MLLLITIYSVNLRFLKDIVVNVIVIVVVVNVVLMALLVVPDHIIFSCGH